MAKKAEPAESLPVSKPDVFAGQGGSYRITDSDERVRVEWTEPADPKAQSPSED